MSTSCEGSRAEVFDAEALCTSWLETCPRHNRKANKGYARGVADERARVVADLRKRARAVEAFSSSRSMALLVIAQDYERGEHEEAT